MTSGADTVVRVEGARPDPGPTPDPHCTPEDGCITCGDVAEEMRVVRIDADRELALCEHASGERQTVEIALVQPVGTSDILLVHAGTAISNLGGRS
jgi:HupF/HypC family